MKPLRSYNSVLFIGCPEFLVCFADCKSSRSLFVCFFACTLDYNACHLFFSLSLSRILFF